MSENIGIGSYDDLSEGANTIRGASENLRSSLETGNSAVSRLQHPKVLEGPLGEYINGIWKIVNSSTKNDISNFEQNASTLNKVEENYHQTDDKSANNVGGVI